MSKSARKHIPARKPRKPHHKPKPAPKFNIKSPVFAIIVTVVLAAIPFCMGKYIEFNSPGAFDSASNVYSAEHILKGAKIGVDERPSAALGTLLVNMLGVKLFGFNEFGPKFIQMIFQAAALIVMFIVMRRLFGTLSASIGVIVASIYLSSPIMAKFGNVKDQFMISLMVLGISCFILYILNNKSWLALLSGASLAWAPLFKETGYSASVAVGLFIIAQLALRHTSLKKTGINIVLLFAGAAISLAPACIWILAYQPKAKLPHEMAFRTVFSALFGNQKTVSQQEAINPETAEKEPATKSFWLKFLPAGYVRGSWSVMTKSDKKELFHRVMRYYWLLILPIALASGAIIARLIRLILQMLKKLPSESVKNYEKFVLLLTIWWMLDMLFVIGSPRSYEQYYLPLNASGAMLGGYLIALYDDKRKTAPNKPAWTGIGAFAVLLMIIASWHIFFGISHSPYSGTKYPVKQRGYFTRIQEILRLRRNHDQYAWEQVGDYIRNNSGLQDVIYVWGWFPGIYVRAQRLSSAPKAFEGTMHTLTSEQLSGRINEILEGFKKKPPKFIVDSRKNEFPPTTPPLELWPSIQNGLLLLTNLPADREQLWRTLLRTFDVHPDDLTREGFLSSDKPDSIRRYDAAYAKALSIKINSTEAQRYKAMKPFREYVMNNYKIVRTFGQHVLFQHK
jgi:hypothetical protein